MEPLEYVSDPLLDEEIDEALGKEDFRAIWKLTSLLAMMDLEVYAIHRAAIKERFGGKIPLADLV